MKLRKNIGKFTTYFLLIVVSIIFLFPVLWLILATFSKEGSIYSFNGFFPTVFSFDTIVKLFTDTSLYNYPRWLLNTLIIAVSSSLISTTLVTLSAYTISRFKFKNRKKLMKLGLVLNMFPAFMATTAVYILMTQFKMINHLYGLIIVYSGTASLGYLVQKGYFDSIPTAIYEAATLDGASNFRQFISITLPLAKPIIVYTALTTFTWPWSDYILPELILKDRDLWTVAVGLMNLPETEFARFAAGAIFVATPIVILYFCLVRNLVSGLSAGAVKS